MHVSLEEIYIVLQELRSLYRNEVASHVQFMLYWSATYITFDLSPLEAGNAANLFDVALQKTTTSYNMQSHFTVS